MLRACFIDFKESWENYLLLIEFSYNKSYHCSIRMARFEALYSRSCKSPLKWFEAVESATLGPEIIHEDLNKVRRIIDRLATVYSVTTRLVVLSNKLQFWKNWQKRRTPRRNVMGTTDRRRVSFQNT